MLCKRIIPCLDVKEGRVVKGINFQNLNDAGDPVELAKFYYEEGADELIFLDISANLEGRKTISEVAAKVAKEIFIPFTIGGGVRTIDDIEKLLKIGADKVAINTAAIENPKLIEMASKEFGSQAIVIAIDAKKSDYGWNTYSYGAKKDTKMNVLNWAMEAQKLGAGEILLTSIDFDGTKKGFDLELNKFISNQIKIPIIASGGAGCEKDFLNIFQKTKVSAALAASLFHYRTIRIQELKKYLQKNEVEIRET